MQSNVNLTIPGTHAKLGDKVRDIVTGFTGIATSYSRALTGCDSVGVLAPVQGDGQKSAHRWVDVACIEVVESNVVNATPMPDDIPAAG